MSIDADDHVNAADLKLCHLKAASLALATLTDPTNQSDRLAPRYISDLADLCCRLTEEAQAAYAEAWRLAQEGAK